MKITLTEEQTSFLNKACTTINTPQGDVYMYLPFWYKKTDVDNVFEELPFGELSGDLKEALSERRNPSDDIPDFDISKTYACGATVKYGGNVWVFKPEGPSPASIYDGIKYVIVSTGVYPGTGNGWKIKKS